MESRSIEPDFEFLSSFQDDKFKMYEERKSFINTYVVNCGGLERVDDEKFLNFNSLGYTFRASYYRHSNELYVCQSGLLDVYKIDADCKTHLMISKPIENYNQATIESDRGVTNQPRIVSCYDTVHYNLRWSTPLYDLHNIHFLDAHHFVERVDFYCRLLLGKHLILVVHKSLINVGCFFFLLHSQSLRTSA